MNSLLSSSLILTALLVNKSVLLNDVKALDYGAMILPEHVCQQDIDSVLIIYSGLRPTDFLIWINGEYGSVKCVEKENERKAIPDSILRHIRKYLCEFYVDNSIPTNVGTKKKSVVKLKDYPLMIISFYCKGKRYRITQNVHEDQNYIFIPSPEFNAFTDIIEDLCFERYNKRKRWWEGKWRGKRQFL